MNKWLFFSFKGSRDEVVKKGMDIFKGKLFLFLFLVKIPKNVFNEKISKGELFMAILKLQSGMKFGEWEVIERDYNPSSKQHSTFWFCKCGLCGKTYSVSRDALVNGKSSCCNHCKGEKIRQKAIERGLSAWQKGDHFGLLEIIDSAGTKNHNAYVKCKCKCGNIVDIRVDHLKGQSHSRTISCGCASQSSGEIKIIQLLEQAQIDFQCQYRIRDFNIGAPFDFAIFNQNKLLGLIEYDGEQHFKAVEIWGGEEQLKKQQERDNKKNQWCKENNILLIRIPYTEYKKLTIEYLLSFFPELSYFENEKSFGEGKSQNKSFLN